MRTYAPLLLRIIDTSSARLVGPVGYWEASGLGGLTISIIAKDDGSVFAGTREHPETASVFVNSSVNRFIQFVDAHSDYTNLTLEKCQLNEAERFEAAFLANVHELVLTFRKLDSHALNCYDYWWPTTMDTTIANYKAT